MQDVLMTLVVTSQSFATSLGSRVPNAGNARVTIPRRASYCSDNNQRCHISSVVPTTRFADTRMRTLIVYPYARNVPTDFHAPWYAARKESAGLCRAEPLFICDLSPRTVGLV
jgi:hypothetical protein